MTELSDDRPIFLCGQLWTQHRRTSDTGSCAQKVELVIAQFPNSCDNRNRVIIVSKRRAGIPIRVITFARDATHHQSVPELRRGSIKQIGICDRVRLAYLRRGAVVALLVASQRRAALYLLHERRVTNTRIRLEQNKKNITQIIIVCKQMCLMY